MELTRRAFLRIGLLLALPFALKITPTSLYPGPIRPLDHDRIRRPAKWAG